MPKTGHTPHAPLSARIKTRLMDMVRKEFKRVPLRIYLTCGAGMKGWRASIDLETEGAPGCTNREIRVHSLHTMRACLTRNPSLVLQQAPPEDQIIPDLNRSCTYNLIVGGRFNPS